MQTWIMHLDMDAFFASVEILDNPALAGLPVAVAGRSDRSVVAAASYSIRKFGVRSAMSVVQARKLCPQAVFVPPRFHRYSEISRQVMAVLERFSPLVEQASIDEAYLDASGLEHLFGPVRDMARALKDEVRAATGLTCSVGLAPVRFLAKIASDLNKPDGLTVIEPDQVRDFLRDLPVGKIPGVGGKTLETLRGLGVRTAGGLLRFGPEFWEARLGSWGPTLWERAQGIDPRPVEPGGEAKSSGAENTFEEDTLDRDFLRRWLLVQSERVAADLRQMGVKARTVTVKIKFADFRQITRSRTLAAATDQTLAVYRAARAILAAEDLPLRVRLIGVTASHFGQGPTQLSLLDPEPPRKQSRLDRAVDQVRQKFGKQAVLRGDVLEMKD